AVLAETLRALRGRAARLCVAEYALRASEAAAAPHVLAAVARGVLECQSAESTANIRSPLSPDAIAAIAAGAGWTVERQGMVVPGPGLLDGHWEAGSVASQSFVREVEDAVRDEGMRLVLASARYAVVAAVEALKGERPHPVAGRWQLAGSWSGKRLCDRSTGSLATIQVGPKRSFKPLKAQCFNPVHYPWQAKGKKQLSHPSLPVVYPDPGARNTISAQGSFSWLDADPAVKHANCHKDTRAARYSVPTAHAVVDIQLLVAVDLANRPAQQTQGTA
ncbi:hypothetical protein OOU_Y34scaffold00164g13, partial [Pyricularia oryzae Y34]